MKQIVPLAATFLGMLFSLAGIVALVNGVLYPSFGLILLAFGTDILDGFIARRLGVESHAGRIADSFADVPLYLLYPAALILYLYGGGYLIVALALFFAAGVFRLMRFTRHGFLGQGKELAYEGVPVFFSLPFAGALLLSDSIGYGLPMPLVALVLVLLAALMVSKIPVRKITDPRTLAVIVATAFSTGALLVWMR